MEDLVQKYVLRRRSNGHYFPGGSGSWWPRVWHPDLSHAKLYASKTPVIAVLNAMQKCSQDRERFPEQLPDDFAPFSRANYMIELVEIRTTGIEVPF